MATKCVPDCHKQTKKIRHDSGYTNEAAADANKKRNKGNSPTLKYIFPAGLYDPW